MANGDQSGRITLSLTRSFAAPRSVVFRAWTEPARAGIWWGPQGFEILSCVMDVRPGGGWRMTLRSADRTVHLKKGVYREVVPGERLVFTWQWLDPDRPAGPDTLVTVTFEDHDDGTKLTLHQAVFDTVEQFEAHRSGWSGCLQRLGAYIAC